MRTIAIAFLLICLGWFRSASAEDIHLRIYPNPASSKVEITVNNPDPGTLHVEIFTVLGTKVQETEFSAESGSATYTLNISNLPEGIYLVRVSQNGNTSVKRLKVQHSD